MSIYNNFTPFRPTRIPRLDNNDENVAPETPTPGPRSATIDLDILRLTGAAPLGASRRYQNGFEKAAPKETAYKPYSLNSSKNSRNKPFTSPAGRRLTAMKALSDDQWNELARSKKIIGPEGALRPFQMHIANGVIGRAGDMCLIAPTGAGKSTVWTLPLLAQKGGVSIVVVPFTSLGVQGENRHRNSVVSATFLHSGNSAPTVLERLAATQEMHVIYACPEMLETPAVARVLHSESFQARISGVYLDEAHVVYESVSWRPAYGRLYLLRQILPPSVPLIALSATLPPRYRDVLTVYAGLRQDYDLINLGNHRPELTIVVKPMLHPASSFLDLDFIFTTVLSLSMIIYCDDLETLTSMFWWIYKRLAAAHLPIAWLDILHAGLSETHQRQCIDGVSQGRTRILLGSEKIGAGMDFPNVGLVVQYRCRGLTLVRWEQRRGRGARRDGQTAMGLILVEKSMTGEASGSPSVLSPGSEDPGLLDVIQATGCLEKATDRHLGNPSRPSSTPTPTSILPGCGRCSNCNPSLASIFHHYTFMLEDFHKTPGISAKTNKKQANAIFNKLVEWRLNTWKRDWLDWPSYGPESLISTSDLQTLSERALAITSLDELDKAVTIIHFNELAASLLVAVQSAVRVACGEDAVNEVLDSLQQVERVDVVVPSNIQWAEPENPDTLAASEACALNERLAQCDRGELAAGEHIIQF